MMSKVRRATTNDSRRRNSFVKETSNKFGISETTIKEDIYIKTIPKRQNVVTGTT